MMASNTVVNVDDATARICAVSMVEPKRRIALPFTQNGKGNQLVPVGSSFGIAANFCANTMRAKSSSLTARKPTL